ncbi:MAG: alpha-1,2-fucosyltransferase [Bacteroidia bacterium]
MIKVGAAGRLANHMFQYAFAISASRKLNTKFDFDTSLLQKYFPVRVKNVLLEKIKKRLIAEPVLKEEHITNLRDPREVIPQLKDETLYSGYFQSEGFFAGNENEVREALTVKAEILQKFKIKYKEQLSKEYSCVAIRLGDYKNWVVEDGLNVSPLLPYSYFHDGIEKLASEENLVFISDEIETVKNLFASKYPNAYFNEKCSDPIEDFLLLQHAKNAVISNSSFYWWACWLNPDRNKKIIVPRYWLGFRKNIEYPTSIIPKDWIQIGVREN